MTTDTPSHDPAADPARRDLLQRVGVSLAAAPALLAAGSAAAQGAASAPPMARDATPKDPRSLYPKPPFSAQRQPWPGLAARMNPKPDHGERSYVGSGRLAGRRALITGGDSGIGRAAAIAYAREGADVAINHLPAEEEDAREVLQLIRAAGRKAVSIPGDLRDEAFCRRLVADAVSQLGGLDILVSNAAMQQAQPSIADISSEQFDSTMKINMYAPFWIIKAALPHLKPGSTIVLTASTVAYDPPEALFDYAATKAATISYTKVLAKQLVSRGIRVNAVAPGPYWTPLQPSGGQLPDKLPQFGAEAPMGRPGQPGEIAPLFVLLASQESSFTTGNVLGSTGGEPQG